MSFYLGKTNDLINIIYTASQLQFLLVKICGKFDEEERRQNYSGIGRFSGRKLEQPDIDRIDPLIERCSRSSLFGDITGAPWRKLCQHIDAVTLFQLLRLVSPKPEKLIFNSWNRKMKSYQDMIKSIEELRVSAIFPGSSFLKKQIAPSEGNLASYERLHNVLLHNTYSQSNAVTMGTVYTKDHEFLKTYMKPLEMIFEHLSEASRPLLKRAIELRKELESHPVEYQNAVSQSKKRRIYFNAQIRGDNSSHTNYFDGRKVTKELYDDLVEYVEEIAQDCDSMHGITLLDLNPPTAPEAPLIKAATGGAGPPNPPASAPPTPPDAAPPG